MRQWWKFGLGILIATVILAPSGAVLLGWQPVTVVSRWFRQIKPPIRLGLLHSKSGPLAISEKSLLDAEILAIEEINRTGGVADRQLVWSEPDCQSDPEVFASQARHLIEREEAVVLIGSWTSECRKALIPVVDEASSLLFYPGNYEGIENSRRVIYAGGAANQTVLPAVRWAFDSLKARRYFVVGMEEVWSRCTSEMAKDAIKAAGATVVGEYFAPAQALNVEAIVDAVRQSKPDVVLNFIYGDNNLAFYAAIGRAGLTPDKLPVIAFAFSEDESRRFPPSDVIGQYAAWSYFQTSTRPENREFVAKFRARFGSDRMVGDSMVAAYNCVMFWAQTAREVGSPNPTIVINNLNRQSMDAPDGIITIDPESRAVYRPFHLGRIRSDGQFEIISSITKPIRPATYIGTRSGDQWRELLESLKGQWRGRWSAGSELDSVSPTPTR